MGLVVIAGCDTGGRNSRIVNDGGSDASTLPSAGAGAGVAPGLDASAGMDAAPPKPDAGPGQDSADARVEYTCTSDKDCTEHGLLCDVLSQLCVECLFDSDCGEQARCVDYECADITPCENSLDCVDDPLDRTVCDEARGECVQCLAETDCPENHDCVDNECREFAPCVNSLDCPPDMVCDTTLGRCLDCVHDADCGPGMVCVAALCRLGCDSDNDCTPHGLLCDRVAGYCAECLAHEDCAEQLFCSLGNCVRDVCRPGTGSCQGNAVVTCSQVGDGYTSPLPCGAQQSCLASGGAASCQDWVCFDPGNRTCTEDNELLIDCAPDGLSYVTVENCARNDGLCVVDECLPVICVPEEVSCDGDDRVLLCSADGLSQSALDDCQTDEYCDENDPACKAQICSPGEPICDAAENVATTCNARGNGFTTGGTDCDDTGALCVDGDCLPIICTPGQLRCDGDDRVLLCNADGTTENLYDDCTTSEYCDENDNTCKAQICSPGQPVCNEAENIATTCNTRGNGYEDGGTDCDDGGMFCVDGECTLNNCGTTVCPGASCVELGTTCAYLVDPNAGRTRSQATTACSGLGAGWSLCTSTQICQSAMHAYLAAQGCDCYGGLAACSVSNNVNIHALDYTTYALWIRDSAYGSCLTTYNCTQSGSVTTGAIVCCHQ
jgi:hypothetical protein